MKLRAAIVALVTLAVLVAGFLLVTGSADSESALCHVSNITVPRSVWSRRDWTVIENRRPGTTDWRLDSAHASSFIQGFADQVSVAPRSHLTLFVSSPRRWRWSAYRLGYYGGAGARLYASSCWIAPQPQPMPLTDPSTRMVTAPWRRSVTIRESWSPGLYLVKLSADNGAQSYIPLTVRSPAVQGDTVFMSSVLTMQAYNHWGGRSLYSGPDQTAGTRSLAVSFDRPYGGHMIGQILSFEQPLVSEAERLGLPLAYLTDIDVATRRDALAGARALMTDGHDEYWTLHERAVVAGARDHGTNLLFFGANQIWWQARLGTTSLGRDRRMFCYRSSFDPIVRRNPELRTTNFRYLPKPMPESLLVGVQYSGLDARAPFVVYAPGFFAFAHTGAKRGSSYPGLVGREVDGVNPGPSSPPSLEIVGRSPAQCRDGACLSESTYYTVPSGAAVWAAGTNGWVDALGLRLLHLGATSRTRSFVRTVTDNLLLTFARGPAGIQYPSKPNVRRGDRAPQPTGGSLGGSAG